MYFLLYLISIPIYLILVLASMLRAIIPTAIAVGIGFLYAFWFWDADAGTYRHTSVHNDEIWKTVCIVGETWSRCNIEQVYKPKAPPVASGLPKSFPNAQTDLFWQQQQAKQVQQGMPYAYRKECKNAYSRVAVLETFPEKYHESKLEVIVNFLSKCKPWAIRYGKKIDNLLLLEQNEGIYPKRNTAIDSLGSSQQALEEHIHALKNCKGNKGSLVEKAYSLLPSHMIELQCQGYRYNTLISWGVKTRREVNSILEYMKRKGMFCSTISGIYPDPKQPNYDVDCNDSTINHKFNITE